MLLRFVDSDLDSGEYLSIEAWNGTNWTLLVSWAGGGLGDDDLWHAESIDLSAYLGRSDFRLRLLTKQNSTSEHVHIDDLHIDITEGAPAPAQCNNAVCESGESCTTCPADCGACPAQCGNMSCEASETCSTCPADCGPCPAQCGNMSCEASESCTTCPADCGACPAQCGNAICEPSESCTSCASDCGTCTPTTVLFSDTFANGLDQWMETGHGDFNTESLHTNTGYPASSSGSPAAHSDNCSTECVLTLRTAVDLTRCQSASLDLLRFIDVQLDAGEFLRVDLWNGAAWVPLASWGGGAGDDDTWHSEQFDLTPFMLVADFRLRLVTKQNSTVEHVHVDDLRIIGQSCNPGPN
jgi:hypothetical protein